MNKVQWLLALLAATSLRDGTAQTVNVNLHNSDQGTTHSAGAGVLGSGPVWTRFEHTWGQNNVLTNLKDDHGVETSWAITDESHSAVGIGTKQSSPNLVQDVAWGGSTDAELRFSNLTPNTLYQVAIYIFRMPTVGFPAAFTVNGQNRTGVTTDVPEIALPGQEGYDYVLFLISSGVAGEIEIVASYGSIAGVQLSPYVPSVSAATLAKIRALKQKIRKLSRGWVSPAKARKIARLRSFVRHLQQES
jgi:hypothetical protein